MFEQASEGVKHGATAAGAAGGLIAGVGGMVPGSGGKGANIAAQSLFTASAAANAIPVAGQFVSAGLAIAGLFTKIFAGRRKKKKEAARKKQQEDKQRASGAIKAGVQADSAGGLGQAQGPQSIAGTAPLQAPATPTFSTYGGGTAPSIQPAQQVLQSSLGFKNG